MSVTYQKPPSVRIADADRNALFASGLEYNTPARGMWNIVHQGMLLPEAHQIYVCAQGCLRGVILTAAEMNALDRLSWVSVTESDLYDGSLESKVTEGVTVILRKLPRKPPVILLYLSCIHLFAGCDFEIILRDLSERFPDIRFVDCYMTPTMRQTISPIAQMTKQLYAALDPREPDPGTAAIIGNDRSTDPNSELCRLLRMAGRIVRDLTLTGSFSEYQKLAESSLNITYLPHAYAAGEALEQRLGIPHLHLPVSFDYQEILANYQTLCRSLGVECPDMSAETAQTDNALDDAHRLIGNLPVAIDFTAVTRPFQLADLLTEHGFNVTAVIADSAAGEPDAFDRLRERCPGLRIYSAANVNMLHLHEHAETPTLAIGQKAAYYFATDHFVNLVMNGGYYGFSGIRALAGLMADAYQIPKDRRAVLRRKGFGCESCLL